MKYIVDIDVFDTLFKVDSIGVFGIGKSLVDSEEDHSWSRIKSIEEFEELNSDYINEHFGDLQDTAYQKGYDAGIIASSFVDKSDEAYQRGLDDAWEAAKKILQMYDFTVFGLGHDGVFESPLNEGQQMTPQEAIEKLKAYEEKQSDKIKVGDEVFNIPTKTKGILLEPETEHLLATVIVPSLRWRTINIRHANLKKTGKHYDIEKLLEAMKK